MERPWRKCDLEFVLEADFGSLPDRHFKLGMQLLALATRDDKASGPPGCIDMPDRAIVWKLSTTLHRFMLARDEMLARNMLRRVSRADGRRRYEVSFDLLPDQTSHDKAIRDGRSRDAWPEDGERDPYAGMEVAPPRAGESRDIKRGAYRTALCRWKIIYLKTHGDEPTEHEERQFEVDWYSRRKAAVQELDSADSADSQVQTEDSAILPFGAGVAVVSLEQLLEGEIAGANPGATEPLNRFFNGANGAESCNGLHETLHDVTPKTGVTCSSSTALQTSKTVTVDPRGEQQEIQNEIENEKQQQQSFGVVTVGDERYTAQSVTSEKGVTLPVFAQSVTSRPEDVVVVFLSEKGIKMPDGSVALISRKRAEEIARMPRVNLEYCELQGECLQFRPNSKGGDWGGIWYKSLLDNWPAPKAYHDLVRRRAEETKAAERAAFKKAAEQADADAVRIMEAFYQQLSPIERSEVDEEAEKRLQGIQKTKLLEARKAGRAVPPYIAGALLSHRQVIIGKRITALEEPSDAQ